MWKKSLGILFVALVSLSMAMATPSGGEAATKQLTFGLLMVGPYNDHGWSQAHYEAGRYVEEKVRSAERLGAGSAREIPSPRVIPEAQGMGTVFCTDNAFIMYPGLRRTLKC